MRHCSWQFHSLLRLYCMHACPIQNYYYVFARVGCMRFFSSYLQHIAFLASVNPIESWFNYYLTSDDIDIWKANINSLICYSKRANNTLYEIQHQNYDHILENIVSNYIYCFEILWIPKFGPYSSFLCRFFSNFPCCFSVFVLFFLQFFVFFRTFFLYFQDSVHRRSIFCAFILFNLTTVLKQYRNEIIQELHQLSHQNRGDREMTILTHQTNDHWHLLAIVFTLVIYWWVEIGV